MGKKEKEFHEVADIFPLLIGNEFDTLKEDISENGLLENIWLHPDGRIIDGRNRYRACQEMGIKPRYRTWSGKGSLVSFAVSLNLHRRHLTSSQRAALAVDVLPMLEEEARERQATSTGGATPQLVEKMPQAENKEPTASGKTRDRAADLFNTNGRYVSDAKVLYQEAPDIFAEVKTGEKTITKANREFKQRIKEPTVPIAGKYRVFYADPPWKYNDSGLDDYGHAERHYPPMTITELCDMGDDIKQASEGDAVLFMWVTSPFLESGFKVINAWGFKHKTSFVWDKIKHNYGHYNSVRHEFLLICTKGSCMPDVATLYDSVQSIERSNKHSEKPEEFREIIDTIYPHGERMELFARKKAGEWNVWGNEIIDE